MKDAGFTLFEAKKWESAGFSPVEAMEWKSIGISVSQAQGWKSAGYTFAEIKAWQSAGFPLSEIKEWKSVGLTSSDAKNWKLLGYTLPEIERYEAAGLPLNEIMGWKSIGLTPSKAEKWKSAGFTLLESERWVSAKLTLSNAKKYRFWVKHNCTKGIWSGETNPYSLKGSCVDLNTSTVFQYLSNNKALINVFNTTEYYQGKGTPIGASQIAFLDSGSRPIPATSDNDLRGMAVITGVFKYENAFHSISIVPYLEVRSFLPHP
jgi:hypothetical protein